MGRALAPSERLNALADIATPAPDDALERAAAAAGFSLVNTADPRALAEPYAGQAMFVDRVVDLEDGGISYLREVQSNPLPIADTKTIRAGRILAGAAILALTLVLWAGLFFYPHG